MRYKDIDMVKEQVECMEDAFDTLRDCCHIIIKCLNDEDVKSTKKGLGKSYGYPTKSKVKGK